MKLNEVNNWIQNYDSELNWVIDNEKRGVKEPRGFDGWVKVEDGFDGYGGELPNVGGEYLVKGTLTRKDGTVEGFVTWLELGFHVEDYMEDEFGCYGDVTAHWVLNEKRLIERGFTDIDITAWKQWEDEEVEEIDI